MEYFSLLDKRLSRIESLLSASIASRQEAVQGERYLEIHEAADLICKSAHTIYGLVSRRKIPHIKNGNRLLFKASELHSWLDEGERITIKEIFNTKTSTL